MGPQTRRPSHEGWLCLLLAAVVTQAVFADQPVIRAGPQFGRGTAYFKVAMLTDLHVGESSKAVQNLQNSVDWIKGHWRQDSIRLVMVTGDMTSSADSHQFATCKQILDELNDSVPYVPLIGNHDMWPYGDGYEAPAECPDTFGPEEYFDSAFASQYRFLDSLSGQSGSPLQGWSRCPRKIWNWDGDNYIQPHYSTFQDFSFDVPAGVDTFHLLCLDFNTRAHAVVPGYKGVMPDADIFPLDFNDATRSVQVASNMGHASYITLYKGIDYQGDSLRVYADDEMTEMPPSWDCEASSVRLGPYVNFAVLYDGLDWTGARRIYLDPNASGNSVPDLRINDPWRWWHDDIANYPHKKQDNIFGVFGDLCG